ANRQLDLSLINIDIRFDLKGRSSGMFVVSRNKAYIRYNEMVFAKFFEDALMNTVAHEVAHYVVHELWGIRNVKPHGREWKQVMAVFNVAADVTSSYDVSDLPLRRQLQHDYTCDCMSHQLSTTRHNKVQNKKAVYKCKKCKQTLTWHNEIKVPENARV
ncbi:hypothetical protein MNBD_GAMMA07-1005, partial [hydrothermal vent metagenome]